MSSLIVGSSLINSTRSGCRHVPSSCGGPSAGACCAKWHGAIAAINKTSATLAFLDKDITACLRMMRACKAQRAQVTRRADSLDHGLQTAKDFLFRQRADQAIHFAPVLQDEQRRDAANAEARRRLRAVIDVEL